MNHNAILREAYDRLETLSVQNDDVGELLADVLAMLEDRHARIIGAFEEPPTLPASFFTYEGTYGEFRG